jgi:hypothetical protein
MLRRLLAAALITLSSFSSARVFAQSTTLPFDGISNLDLLAGYGDRVTGAVTGAFTYGGTGSYTPNVLLGFGCAEGGFNFQAFPWSGGYNDLINIIYASVAGTAGAGGELQVTLTADPGYRVSVQSFDIGNWGAAITLPYVRVTNENGAVVFEELNVALNESASTIERNFVLSPAPVGRILTVRISLDGLAGSADNVGLDNLTFGQQTGPSTELGTPYCAPASSNSSLWPASIRAWGQASAAANDVRLVATELPYNSFGFFLTSRGQGFVANAGGSQGNLCLSGAIGRYVGPGQIRNSGTGGVFELRLDLTRMPTPTGSVVAAAGQTWNFQAWYRDANPGSTSNFTSAVGVLLQ